MVSRKMNINSNVYVEITTSKFEIMFSRKIWYFDGKMGKNAYFLLFSP